MNVRERHRIHCLLNRLVRVLLLVVVVPCSSTTSFLPQLGASLTHLPPRTHLPSGQTRMSASPSPRLRAALSEVAVNAQAAAPPSPKPPRAGWGSAALVTGEDAPLSPVADAVDARPPQQALAADLHPQRATGSDVRKWRHDPYRAPELQAAPMWLRTTVHTLMPSQLPSRGWRHRTNEAHGLARLVMTSAAADRPTLVLVAFAVRAEWRAVNAKLPLPPLGTFVVVSGSRGGKDVGCVVEYGVADGGLCGAAWDSQLPSWRVPIAAPQKPRSAPSAKVIRLASAAEVAGACRLAQTYGSEMVPHIQSLVEAHAASTMDASLASFRVLGAEAQYFKGNVMVYFSADVRVLIKAVAARLRRVFRCRVWMQQVSLDETPQPVPAAPAHRESPAAA